MTTLRHATIEEITDDVQDVLAETELFDDSAIEALQATRFTDVVKRINGLMTFPAAIVMVGPAHYPDEDDMGMAMRARLLQVSIVIVGELDAALNRGNDDVWSMLDTVERLFLPTAEAPLTSVTINDVRYEPMRAEPVDLGEDGGVSRSAYVLTLQTSDDMRERA